MKYQIQSNRNFNVLFFRKWGRKSYSLYSTLKKVAIISTLSVSYFLSVPVSAVAMPQDTTEIKMQYDLDEIEVTASRAPVLYSQVARVLTIIDAKQIQRMPAESVQDLLEYVAGVDIRQRGAEGVQADISIRGGTFDQILILLNGINITDPQTGHHNLNIPVSLAQIERIEILEGPAARVYGPNAFSGAINIITRKPDHDQLSTYITTGSFGYLNAGVSGSIRSGRFSQMLAGNRKKSDGYIDNTDFKSSDIYYSGEYASNTGALFFQGGFADKQFGANSFYTPVYPNQFEKVQTYFGSARFESQTKMNLTPAIYWRRHSDTFMLFRENAPDWYANHNFHRTDVWGADLNSWFTWMGGKTSFGTGFRSEAILSNVLGDPLEETITFSGKEKFFTHSKIRRNASLFAEHTFYIDELMFTAGVMANYITDRQEGIKFFPGFDVGYPVFQSFKLIASWNTSLRMPTFTDLYYSGPTNVGNPDLKPEKVTALEGGGKLSTRVLKGHVIFFHRKGTDLIDWIRAEEDELWQSTNHTEINSRGMEITLTYFPEIHLNKNLPARVGISYLYNQQQKEEGSFLSYYVMDNLRNKFVASVNQKISKKIFIDINAVFQDREGTFTLFDGGSYTREVEYRPFWTVDSKVVWELGHLDLFLSANNLFNQQYYDIGNVIQPGRWLKAGISCNFQK